MSQEENCYYCDEPLTKDGSADWCWIKTGPDGSDAVSMKVHDTCAAPIIKAAKAAKDAKET